MKLALKLPCIRFSLSAPSLVGTAILALLIISSIFLDKVAQAQSFDNPCPPREIQPTKSILLVKEITPSQSATLARGLFFEGSVDVATEDFSNATMICLSSSASVPAPLRVDDYAEIRVVNSSGSMTTWARDFYDPKTKGILETPSLNISTLFQKGSSTVHILLRDFYPPAYSSSAIWLLFWSEGLPTPAPTASVTPLSTPEITLNPTATTAPTYTPTRSLQPTPLGAFRTPMASGIAVILSPSGIVVDDSDSLTLEISIDPEVARPGLNQVGAGVIYSNSPNGSQVGRRKRIEDPIDVYPGMLVSAELTSADMDIITDDKVSTRVITTSRTASWIWTLKTKKPGLGKTRLNIYTESEGMKVSHDLLRSIPLEVPISEKDLSQRILEYFANNLIAIVSVVAALAVGILGYRASRAGKKLEEKVETLEKEIKSLREYESDGKKRKQRR